ncbi:hypothetical protein [Microbispora amethystogenes]|uniref:Streptomycin biosynthesis protein StrG n=1 Tax=Microbispora amethystogenes TaxID=1427754 RepID=A0ABQ4FLY2_9ACTN|nr:hypothetical protein [Microbispora amethystogenes]GIH35810.1 hypothetical protein Mam01_59740 [Microbispora amethystogenes]
MHPVVHEPVIYDYDAARFDFGDILRKIYDVDDLARLRPEGELEVMTWKTDQSTDFHAKFYEAFEAELKPLYREFVAAFVPGVLGTEEFCFQQVPTFRVHFPGNVAVGDFHRDRDYNHGDGEVNFWVPFTPAYDTNSVWIERELGSGDYRPMTVDPGQVLVFDSVDWSHGNKINETGSTRVSFDFRCIRLSDYNPSTLRTVDAKRGLWIGDYFDVL